MGNSDNLPPDRLADEFITTACQYYAAARFAMRAQCMPVCGNLFHHTVEMFLKAGLAQRRKAGELKRLGHDLEKTWRVFKVDFPDPALIRHNETISTVHKFEDIRYPEWLLKHGALMSANWSSLVGGEASHSEGIAPKQYTVIVNNIDDLVADVFKVCSKNPIAFIGSTLAAREAIMLNNLHAEFLTQQ